MDLHRDFTHFQEGARRYQAAMAGVPDRVPVFAQMHEFVMRHKDLNAGDFFRQPNLIVPASLEVQDEFRIDIAYVCYDVYNIEAEALGQKVNFNDDHMPDIDRSSPLIKDQEDLKMIKTPDFDSDARFPVIVEILSLFRKLTGIEPELQFTAPFSLAASIRGIEPLLQDIYLEPEFAGQLLDRLTEEVIAPWILYQKDKFPLSTSICGSDAIASLPIVNPHILEHWVSPYILHLRELCGPEVYVANWVGERYLEDPRTMLDMKLKVCPTFIEGQDPDVEALGPEFYKCYAIQQDVPLILGVGAGFMALSSPDQVFKRVKQYIEIGGENGRFALYLCNLGANTPPENVIAAIKAVDQYGVYS